MDTQGTERTERVNEGGAIETKVETADFRSPAGHDEPTKEHVGVVHLTRKNKESGTGDGIMARTAAAVTNTIKSAKDAIVGRGKSNTSN